MMGALGASGMGPGRESSDFAPSGELRMLCSLVQGFWAGSEAP